MGKSQIKKYFIISDFKICSNNRGTAALGYGAVAFLQSREYIDESYEIVKFTFYANPFQKKPSCVTEELEINGKKWKYHTIEACALEKYLYKYRVHFFNTLFKQMIEKVKFVAALNGGDGLTDIYGEALLDSRLPEMRLAMACRIPFIVMPQTIGPFLEEKNKKRILNILKNAQKIFVRDKLFVDELNRNGIDYEETKDLSFFMNPEPFPITIQKPCVGINVSGLAYSNKYGKLVGQFDSYPKLITELVKNFQRRGCSIYIIPHAYNVNKPELNNDDMVASADFYERLEDKRNVYFVNQDLISPQVKYVISQMDFFIGTRMHANFAAIFTGVPLFGLAYSYKFKGAFTNNGIFDRTYDINNLPESDIAKVVSIIERAYQEDIKR